MLKIGRSTDRTANLSSPAASPVLDRMGGPSATCCVTKQHRHRDCLDIATKNSLPCSETCLDCLAEEYWVPRDAVSHVLQQQPGRRPASWLDILNLPAPGNGSQHCLSSLFFFGTGNSFVTWYRKENFTVEEDCRIPTATLPKQPSPHDDYLRLPCPVVSLRIPIAVLPLHSIRHFGDLELVTCTCSLRCQMSPSVTASDKIDPNSKDMETSTRCIALAKIPHRRGESNGKKFLSHVKVSATSPSHKRLEIEFKFGSDSSIRASVEATRAEPLYPEVRKRGQDGRTVVKRTPAHHETNTTLLNYLPATSHASNSLTKRPPPRLFETVLHFGRITTSV
ncbi:hypothetical protein VTK26DRAFT_8410 [Humicola hyalothermophila]